MFVEEKVVEQLLHKKANNLMHELQSAMKLLHVKEQRLVKYEEKIKRHFEWFSKAVASIAKLVNEGKPVPESYHTEYKTFSSGILKDLQDEFLSEQHIGEDIQKAMELLLKVESYLKKDS